MIEFKSLPLTEYSYIDRFVEMATIAEALREEEFIRKYAPYFIHQGYRLCELELIRRKLAATPNEDELSLRIRFRCEPSRRILDMRLLWRRWFPYKIPTDMKGCK